MKPPQITFALLALALASPLLAAERVVLAGTGLSIERPDGWHQGSMEQTLESMEQTGYGNAGFRRRARIANAGVPFLSFTKRGAHTSMAPVVRIGVRPRAEVGGWTPEEVLQATVDVTARAVPSAHATAAPAASTRFGPGGAMVRIAYTADTPAGPLPVHSQMWTILRGDFLYSFSITMAEDEVDSLWPEAEAILDSVRIGAPVDDPRLRAE